MKSIDAFLPYVMPYARGCPAPTAFHAIREATRTFCLRTKLWRGGDSFTIMPGQCASIAVPYGAELCEMERVDFDGKQLEPQSVQWLDEHYPDWLTGLTGSAPSFVTQLAPDTLAVVPAAEGRVTTRLVLMPSIDAMEVPDFLVDKYGRAIGAGALADILLLPGQPFSNPQLAQVHVLNFEREIDRFSGMNIRGQQLAPMRTKAQFF